MPTGHPAAAGTARRGWVSEHPIIALFYCYSLTDSLGENQQPSAVRIIRMSQGFVLSEERLFIRGNIMSQIPWRSGGWDDFSTSHNEQRDTYI